MGPEIELDADDGLENNEIDLSLSATDFDEEKMVNVSFLAQTDPSEVTCQVDDEDVQLRTETKADGRVEIIWATVVDQSATITFPGASIAMAQPFQLSWECEPDVSVVSLQKNKNGDMYEVEEQTAVKSKAI